MCIMPHPICAYYFSAFGETARLFGYLLLETAMTEFTLMYFVCFIQSVEYGTADLFLLACLQGLCEDSRLCVNQVLLAPSHCEMEASVLKRGVLRNSSNCAIDPLVAIIDFVHAEEMDWIAPDCFG